MSAASVTVLPRRTPPSILVLEGDVRLRCLVSDELRAIGFKVMEASSAREALTVLDAVRIDLLLLDLDLQPTGSGLDVIRHLDGNQPPTWIIGASCAADPMEKLHGLELSIRKPYPISQVIELVSRSLNWPQPPEA
jgi:DNA-binding response OmpR family regulator